MVFQVATVHIQPIEAARLNLSVAGQMTMKTAKHVAGEHGKEILKYKKDLLLIDAIDLFL